MFFLIPHLLNSSPLLVALEHIQICWLFLFHLLFSFALLLPVNFSASLQQYYLRVRFHTHNSCFPLLFWIHSIQAFAPLMEQFLTRSPSISTMQSSISISLTYMQHLSFSLSFFLKHFPWLLRQPCLCSALTSSAFLAQPVYSVPHLSRYWECPRVQASDFSSSLIYLHEWLWLGPFFPHSQGRYQLLERFLFVTTGVVGAIAR